jgi:hypothetical protein
MGLLPAPGTAGRPLVSGAIAGAATAFAFAALHHLIISDIWFSLVPMMVVGALCGLCLVWSYDALFPRPTVRGWLGYNGLFVGLLVLLGIASVLVFEPVTTMAAVMAAGGSPDHLIADALPLAIGFTLGAAALISLLFGRSPRQAFATLVTCTMIIGVLGLNISPLGLVEPTGEMAFLLAMMYVLLAAIMFGFAGIYLALERRHFVRARVAREQAVEAPVEPVGATPYTPAS